MTEEEFIRNYCIWCDLEDYAENCDKAQWDKNCYAYERCYKRWGKDETVNNST